MVETVRPGRVDWTGDNPFIYLKTDPGGDWSSLSLFFRITASGLGLGHLILVLEDPYGAAGESHRHRVAFTDNAPLARFLIDGFVRKFALFRPSAVLDDVEVIDGARFWTDAGDKVWTESCEVAGRSVELCWEDLGDSFAVDQPPAESGTGAHEMFSVFRPASAARVIIDGQRLAGETVARAFFGREAQSAAMALSETWVVG